MSGPVPGDDLLAYHGAGLEDERLVQARGPLELERTRELLGRHLRRARASPTSAAAPAATRSGPRPADTPSSSSTPCRSNVERARDRAGEPPRFGCRLGDARALPFADAEPDAVLLLGWFHLPTELVDELEAAGLAVTAAYGVEGPGWLLGGVAAAWDDPGEREHLLAGATTGDGRRAAT